APARALGRARLGGGERPHLIRDRRQGDERPRDRRHGASPGRLHRASDRPAAAAARGLRRRSAYGVEIERIVEEATRTGTMMEINGNPNRRDLNEHHAKLAAEAGVRIVCKTDAHGPGTPG